MTAMGGKCEECNENDFEVLEFHHTKEKLVVYGSKNRYIIKQLRTFGKTGIIPKDLRLLCPTHHKKADLKKKKEAQNVK